MAGDRAGAAAAISDEIIDASAICCRAADLDDRLAEYERAGADTLLAMPFGDRPRIVEALAAAALTQLVVEFEKPRFVEYQARLCAHSRAQRPGCNRCLDVCSTGAISADGDFVTVEPHLCAGCGGCGDRGGDRAGARGRVSTRNGSREFELGEGRSMTVLAEWISAS